MVSFDTLAAAASAATVLVVASWTRTVDAADLAVPDWTALGFPSGAPVPISGSTTGDTYKVPIPPVADSWTKAIVALAPSPIPDEPLAPEIGTPWRFSKATDLVTCPSKTWAVTYDDGPKDFTPQYLNLLSNTSTTATFFVLGSNVVNNPEWARNLKAAYDAGHQIGLHSWTHRRLTNESTEQVIAEFIWNALAVKQVINKVPRYIRPPYGDTNDRVRAIFGAFGFKQVIWSCDTQDTKIQSGNTGSWRVNDTVQLVNGTTRIGLRATFPDPFFDDTGGYISLEHELSSEELSAATQIIALLKKNAYTLTSVAKCVAGAEADADRYMNDSDPFVIFLNSIKFPIDQKLFQPTATPSGGTGKSGNSSTSSGSARVVNVAGLSALFAATVAAFASVAVLALL